MNIKRYEVEMSGFGIIRMTHDVERQKGKFVLFTDHTKALAAKDEEIEEVAHKHIEVAGLLACANLVIQEKDARIARLEEALKPFANAADYPPALSEGNKDYVFHSFGTSDPRVTAKMTLGDLWRAKEALSDSRPPERKEEKELQDEIRKLRNLIFEHLSSCGHGLLEKDEFYCPLCHAHDLDYRLIPHEPNCLIAKTLGFSPDSTTGKINLFTAMGLEEPIFPNIQLPSKEPSHGEDIGCYHCAPNPSTKCDYCHGTGKLTL